MKKHTLTYKQILAKNDLIGSVSARLYAGILMSEKAVYGLNSVVHLKLARLAVVSAANT